MVVVDTAQTARLPDGFFAVGSFADAFAEAPGQDGSRWLMGRRPWAAERNKDSGGYTAYARRARTTAQALRAASESNRVGVPVPPEALRPAVEGPPVEELLEALPGSGFSAAPDTVRRQALEALERRILREWGERLATEDFFDAVALELDLRVGGVRGARPERALFTACKRVEREAEALLDACAMHFAGTPLWVFRCAVRFEGDVLLEGSLGHALTLFEVFRTAALRAPRVDAVRIGRPQSLPTLSGGGALGAALDLMQEAFDGAESLPAAVVAGSPLLAPDTAAYAPAAVRAASERAPDAAALPPAVRVLAVRKRDGAMGVLLVNRSKDSVPVRFVVDRRRAEGDWRGRGLWGTAPTSETEAEAPSWGVQQLRGRGGRFLLPPYCIAYLEAPR